MSLTIEAQKNILTWATFRLTTKHETFIGRIIGFDRDHRGFGAVVIYPNGTRVFWGVDRYTGSLIELGTPPPPPRKRKRRETHNPLALTYQR